MKHEQAKTIVEALKLLTQDAMKNMRSHPMTALIINKGETTSMVLDHHLGIADQFYKEKQFGAAERAKMAMWDEVREAAKKLEAEGVVIIGECWSYDAKPGDVTSIPGDEPGKARDVGIIARSHPDRYECLYLSWEFQTEDAGHITGAWSREFKRDANIFEFTDRISEGVDATGGGMSSNLLPKEEE